MRARRASAGFTLVDMLVALSLLAIIAVLTTGFFNQLRSIKRIQDETAIQMELAALSAYLEQVIERAMPLPLVDEALTERHYLVGTRASLRFITIIRQGTRSFGLRDTVFSLVTDADRAALVQNSLPRRIDVSDLRELGRSITLANDALSIEFSYLTYDPASYAPIWVEEWARPRALPSAIRFELAVERGGKTYASTGHALLRLADQETAQAQR